MILGMVLGVMLFGSTVPDSVALDGAVRAAIIGHVAAAGEEAVIGEIRFPRAATSERADSCFIEPLPAARWGGRLVVMVDLVMSGGGIRRIPVSCAVRTFGVVCVAVHRLDRHVGLTAEDVALQRVETTHLPDDALRTLGTLAGNRTQRIIREGAVLCAGMLEAEPAIHAGDPVTLLTRANGVHVSIAAVAREDGRVGGIVTVQQTGGHLRFRGKVLDARTVERQVE